MHPSSSITRLSQAHINFFGSYGDVLIGKKGLTVLEGQFLSESRFNFIPRVFNQISYQTPSKNRTKSSTLIRFKNLTINHLANLNMEDTSSIY